MMDLGQLLRQKREAQELSLADVEEQTRIRQRYLSALESDDWDDLPNEVVARGFLRTYASFLGLDPDELLAQVDSEQPSAEAQTEAATESAPEQQPAYRPIDLDLYGDTAFRPRRLRRILGIMLVLVPVVILAFVLVVYGLPLLLGQTSGSSKQPVVTLPPEGTPPSTPRIVVGGTQTPESNPQTSVLPATDTPLPTATSTPQPSPTPSPTPVQELTVLMKITQRAWTQVIVDGEIQVEEILIPGYTQRFTANERIELLTGNAAGVSLIVNGQPQPSLGEPAEVVALIWTVEDGTIVLSTPTPEPELTGSPTITPEEGVNTATVEPGATDTPEPEIPESSETPTAEPQQAG